MAQQQHPRLRRVNFADFPLFIESTAHDRKTSYQSFSRVSVECVGSAEIDIEARQTYVLSEHGVPDEIRFTSKSTP